MFSYTPAQQNALELISGKSRNIMLFGGSRSGKTFLLVYAVLIRALRVPGSRHVILRFRGNSVRQAVMRDTLPKVIRLAFPGLHYTESRADQFITLPNRSEILLGHFMEVGSFQHAVLCWMRDNLSYTHKKNAKKQ